MTTWPLVVNQTESVFNVVLIASNPIDDIKSVKNEIVGITVSMWSGGGGG
jgi:hypothetical protein